MNRREGEHVDALREEGLRFGTRARERPHEESAGLEEYHPFGEASAGGRCDRLERPVTEELQLGSAVAARSFFRSER